VSDATVEYVDYVTGRLPHLRRVAHALAGDAHRADDLVQETITKLFVHWRRASRAENLDGYVRTMLVRTFLDERRLRWSKVRLTDAVPEPAPRPDHDSDDGLTVRAALAHLPHRQRAVLVLRFLADLSVDEVAQVMRCSPGTVKSQTFHGLAAMRRLLTEPARSGKES
jgi:RNA polymerase sigma-70 factor (sigma-E family)